MNFFVVGGKFCQLPRAYLAAIDSKYLKGCKILRHCYYGTCFNFIIHKFCQLEAKQILFCQ